MKTVKAVIPFVLAMSAVVSAACGGQSTTVTSAPALPTETAAASPGATATSTPTTVSLPTATPQAALAASQVPESPLDLNAPPADYYVLPVLFVPRDLTPGAYNTAEIDRRVEQIQRWYAEQLRGVTFTLRPAVTLIGSYDREQYYPPCFPPIMACDWGYALWGNIDRDLIENLGYATTEKRLVALFIQSDGMGGTALGGWNLSMNGLGWVVGDCLDEGCMYRLNEGGLAHEVGHSFGLPHTEEGEYSLSLMGGGFYIFPKTTFANSSANPEIDTLVGSPFLNQQTPPTDGGFEDCLEHWTVENASGGCEEDDYHSGLSAAWVSATGDDAALLRQSASLEAGGIYDITGWARMRGGETAAVLVRSFASDGTLIEDSRIAQHTPAAARWEKIGGIYRAPANGTRFELVIEGAWSNAVLDDFAIHRAYRPPVSPLPLTHHSGDAFAGPQVELQWSDVPYAPVYQLQVAEGEQFTAPLLQLYVSSPFYTIGEGVLEAGRIYNWRVRAGSGAGWSEWSPTWQMALRPSGEYVGEEFGDHTLDRGWTWLRELELTWGFQGYVPAPGSGFLSILVQEGSLAGPGNDAKNVLLREAPQGDWAIGTRAELWIYPYLDGQQGGLIVYQDDDNSLMMSHSFNEGYRLEWTAEIDGEIVVHDLDWSEVGVPMRIVREGDTYSAWYTYDGVEWRSMPSSVTVEWDSPRVGLTAFGPRGGEPVTAHFDYFRFAYLQ